MSEIYNDELLKTCKRVGAEFLAVPLDYRVGVSLAVKQGLQPINGLRHLSENGTTGWYIWGDETLSDAPDFFEPVCVRHLPDWCPNVVPYLGLAPGWRFLIAEEYEDVWFDPALLR